MNTTIITAEDLKALQKSTSRSMRLTTLIMIPLVIAFLIVAGAINLYFCSRFSDMAGMSMADVIRGWFAGIDISKEYSGTYLRALERWEASIIQFALAAFAAFMFVIGRRTASRNARILRFIEGKSI